MNQHTNSGSIEIQRALGIPLSEAARKSVPPDKPSRGLPRSDGILAAKGPDVHFTSNDVSHIYRDILDGDPNAQIHDKLLSLYRQELGQNEAEILFRRFLLASRHGKQVSVAAEKRAPRLNGLVCQAWKKHLSKAKNIDNFAWAMTTFFTNFFDETQ